MIKKQPFDNVLNSKRPIEIYICVFAFKNPEKKFGKKIILVDPISWILLRAHTGTIKSRG